MKITFKMLVIKIDLSIIICTLLIVDQSINRNNPLFSLYSFLINFNDQTIVQPFYGVIICMIHFFPIDQPLIVFRS